MVTAAPSLPPVTPPDLSGSETLSTDRPEDVPLPAVLEAEAGRVPFQDTSKAGPTAVDDAHAGWFDWVICN